MARVHHRGSILHFLFICVFVWGMSPSFGVKMRDLYRNQSAVGSEEARTILLDWVLFLVKSVCCF